MSRRIRVLIVDDQRVVREGLTMVLGLLENVDVVGAASDGAEALALLDELGPDVVLMDLRMPRCDGVEATRLMRAARPDLKIVILTTYSDDRSVIDALRAGAHGYLTKDAGGEQIRQALAHVLDGYATIDPAVQHHLVDAIAAGPATAAPSGPAGSGPETPAPADELTPRETEVLVLIAHGLSNSEIAARLVISEGTVKSHINRLLAKIQVRSRAQAVTYAFQHGLA